MEQQNNADTSLDGIPGAGELIDGKYEVDGIIGIGGMGVVLVGTHLHLQQPVAIKLLLPAFVTDKDVRGRFLREARAAARLRSDHVTRIYDVGALDSGLPYIVMERLEGINLADSLEQEGPFDVRRAVGYVLQACEAVAEAHAAGIVHRDLKPANLFLAQKPNGSAAIKVLDFGISKTADDRSRSATGVPALTGPHSLLGSPHYMSPEQVRDSSEVDARTDVWALGVLLYELLTRRMPFDAVSLPHLYARILSEPPIPPQHHGVDLPDGLVSTLFDCLRKNVDERIANVGDLAERLATFGPPWADSSVEHVRHALEGRSSPSIRPRLSPVVYTPTPTSLGSQATVPVVKTEGVQRRRRKALRFAGLIGLGAVAVVSLVATLTIDPIEPRAHRVQAASMLQGLAPAHRAMVRQFDARLAAFPGPPEEESASVETTGAAMVASPDESESAVRRAPRTASARDRASAARPSSRASEKVKDLKSITLLD